MAKETVAKQTRTRRKRRARRQRPEELVQYVIQVTGWDYYYGLRPGDPKNTWDKHAYEELATLAFSGSLIEPQLPKIDRALITLSGRAGMLDQPIGETHFALGSISSRSGDLSAYVFTPQERLGELAVLAQSGRAGGVEVPLEMSEHWRSDALVSPAGFEPATY